MSSVASVGSGAYAPGQSGAVDIDVKGFGAGRDNDGDKLELSDSIARIKELLSYIRENEPNTPTYLVGESMGGAIAIAVAARYPELVDGIICSAPAWKVYKRKRTTAKSIFDLVMTSPGPAVDCKRITKFT